MTTTSPETSHGSESGLRQPGELEEAERLEFLGIHGVGKILSCVSDEASALVVSALPHAALPPDAFTYQADPTGPHYQTYMQHAGPDAVIERGQIDRLVQKLQGGETSLKYPPYFFGHLLDDMASTYPDVIEKVQVNDDPYSQYGYKLTEAGFWLFRPTAGELQKWGRETQLPLNTAFGASQPGNWTDDGEVIAPASVIIRLEVLAALTSRLYAPLTNKDVMNYTRDTLSERTIRNHLTKLTISGLVVREGRRDSTYQFASPEIRWAMRKLVVIYRRMSELDPDFYHEGHKHADAIMSNPHAVRRSLKRLEKSKKGLAPTATRLGGIATQTDSTAEANTGLHGLNCILRDREDERSKFLG